MSPLPPIAHLLALAAGLFVALSVMPWVSPDLSSEETDPAVAAAAQLQQISGGDPNSLFRGDQLAAALSELEDQLGAGEEMKLLQIYPGRLDTSDSGSGVGFSPDDVEVQAPARIIAAIAGQRSDVGQGLDDVQFMQLRASLDGEPRWYVQLSLEIDPPRTFGAELDGSGVTPGN